ncbi:transmembrane protein 18-domain-containing protein [Sporodiniella umbellata]|nr:transmembrane protein 18-domain-containing protein [Sporodiniella umbellata]
MVTLVQNIRHFYQPKKRSYNTLIVLFLFVERMPGTPDEIVNNILKDLRSGVAFSTKQTHTFLTSIDWTEHWIQLLLAFHVVCFLILVLTRKYSNGPSICFFVFLGFALLTQPLNTLGITHWKLFSKSPYFEKSGIFIVSVYAGPLLVNAFIALVLILKSTLSLMIAVKQKQLRKKTKKS